MVFPIRYINNANITLENCCVAQNSIITRFIMVKICCIADCNNSDKRNLFVIPKCEERQREWYDAISPHMRKGKKNRKVLYVCDAHFKDDDILRNRLIHLKDGKVDAVPCFRVTLKPSSIPSIFTTGVSPRIKLPAVDNKKSNTPTSEESRKIKVSICEGAKDKGLIPKEKKVTVYTLKMLENDLQLWWQKNNISIWRSLMISSGLLISFFGENFKVATKTILVNEDMSTEIRAAGVIIMRDFKEKIKSVDDMLSLMTKLKINHLCRGSDNNTPCPKGYFESSTSPSSERCISCRIERKKRLNCLLKAKKRAICQADRDKRLIKNLKRKNERLVKNMTLAKENMKQLKAQYALAWNTAIKKIRKNFTSMEQNAVTACPTAAQCRCATGIQYNQRPE